MNLSRILSFASLALCAALLLVSCKEDTVKPVGAGSIQGTVYDTDGTTPAAGANVTTTPPTSSVVTDAQGGFLLEGLPEGDYVVSANKPGYQRTTVSVSVKDGKTTPATIFLTRPKTTNTVPNQPVNISPANNSTGQPKMLTLTWTGSDPDTGDELLFDVFLYESSSPQPIEVVKNVTDTTIDLSDLKYGTSYFWQVIARDSSKETALGPVWSFSTVPFPEYPILYAAYIDGNYEIFSLDPDSLWVERITSSPSRDFWPRYTNRRDRIGFISDRSGQPQIYTMKPDGSDVFRVTTLPVAGYHNDGMGFAFSPDGGEVLYANYDKLYRIFTPAYNLRQVALAPAGRHFRECDWSPDYKKIVVVTVGVNAYDTEIYLINEGSSDLVKLVDNLPGIVSGPGFTVDGRAIIYTRDFSGHESQDGRQLDQRIYKINLDGSEEINLSFNKPAGTNDSNPRFSPDGSKIIFVNAPNDKPELGQVWIMEANGDGRRKLNDSGLAPDWR